MTHHFDARGRFEPQTIADTVKSNPQTKYRAGVKIVSYGWVLDVNQHRMVRVSR